MNSGDKWTAEEYEAAIESFVKGKISAIAFVAALARLEMDRAARPSTPPTRGQEATLYGSEQ